VGKCPQIRFSMARGIVAGLVMVACCLPFGAAQMRSLAQERQELDDVPVRYGHFAWYQEWVDEDRLLLKQDGSQIAPDEVAALYGTPDGMTIYEDGVDICSWDYAAKKGLPAPLQPVYQDLSAGAGWPDIHVSPGYVAIDPHQGRFILAAGDDDPASLVGSAWTGFGVPGSGFIELQGDYAYLPAGEGEVQVLDVSEAYTPTMVSRAYGDFNYALGAYGDYLYLYRNNRGMSAIEISDPTDLDWYPDETLARVWEAPDNLRMNAIEIRDEKAFVTVSAEPGFYSLDLGDPLNAVELDGIDVGDPEGANWVFLSGDRAYVALNSGNGLLDGSPYTHRWSAGFAVIDISNPGNLSILGTYLGEPGGDIYSAPRLIGVSGDLAIMATVWRPGNYPPDQPAKLVLVDASDPANITRRGEYAFMDGEENEARVDLYSAVGNGSILYVSDNSYDSTGDSLYFGNPEDYTTLFTFDIDDPDDPRLLDRYDQPEPSRFRHLTLDNDKLYINDYNYGVRVFDCSDPQHPAPAGGAVTAAEGRFAWVHDAGERVYATETYGGSIRSIDIHDVTAPSVQGTYWDGLWNEKQRPTGRDDALYVPTTTQISILDVSYPITTTKVGSFSDAGTHSTLSLFGNYAYVLTMSAGDAIRSRLHVYDITDPLLPVLAGELDLEDRHEKVFAQGDFAYAVADGYLKIIDVSDANEPSVKGELVDARLMVETRDEGGRMWVREGVAYIITGQRDEVLFHLVDVSDPEHPAYLSAFSYELGGNVQSHHVTDIIISGKYLYLGIYWGSFAIFDITDPLSPVYVEDGKSLPLDFEGWNAGWGLGQLAGDHLALPTLSHLRMIDVPRDSEALTGLVTTASNLGDAPGDAMLSWEEDPASAGGYDLYRSTQPYFSSNQALLLAHTPAGTLDYADAGAGGYTPVNYFYLVVGLDGGGEPADFERRLGEFDFGVVPGG